ncbi:MAG: hypothetical protein MUO21_01130 [Nitrososphaeraceae archaeon]|nr:hypothetical protein [Nitrososphaeraceae archaeon]
MTTMNHNINNTNDNTKHLLTNKKKRRSLSEIDTLDNEIVEQRKKITKWKIPFIVLKTSSPYNNKDKEKTS